MSDIVYDDMFEDDPSDTPRTDAHSLNMESEDFDVELAKTYQFARQLERELNAAEAENAAMREVIKEAQTTLENCYQVHRAITKDQPTSGA